MSGIKLPQSVRDVLPAVRQTLGGPRNLIVVDASGDNPVVSVAYFRAWIADGVRLLARAGDHDWLDVDRWLGDDTKLLIVLAQGRALSDQMRDLINHLEVHSYRVLGVEPETMTILQGMNPLPEHVDQRYAEAVRTTLELNGSDKKIFARVTLPMKLRISSREADPFSAHFAVAAAGPDLPSGPPTWFRLEPGFEGILSIDRDVDLRGDAWRLALDAGSGPVRKLVQTAPLPGAEARPLDAIAVVLDRTCPDNSSWERALNLTNARAEVAEPWRDGQAAVPEQYNADIRRGLADGLKLALQSNLVREVKSWWFKDIPGEGVANFVTAMDLEGEEIGPIRAVRSEHECEDLFAVAGYSPGLDLWDPVEVALLQARHALDVTGIEHRAILLVGNSPPRHPTQDSPLTSLAFPPGASTQCTIRHHSSDWHDVLANCAESRIPVQYLFLRHTAFGAVRPAVIELYEQSQSRVEHALSQTVGLEAATAEYGAVRDAVVQAIGRLRAEAGLTSRVKLQELKAGSDETR